MKCIANSQPYFLYVVVFLIISATIECPQFSYESSSYSMVRWSFGGEEKELVNRSWFENSDSYNGVWIGHFC